MAYFVKAKVNGKKIEGEFEAKQLIEELEKVVEHGKEEKG